MELQRRVPRNDHLLMPHVVQLPYWVVMHDMCMSEGDWMLMLIEGASAPAMAASDQSSLSVVVVVAAAVAAFCIVVHPS